MGIDVAATATALRARLGRIPPARLLDLAVLLWITIFHRVLVAKLRFGTFGWDEPYFLNEGWSVVKGLVPYRDLQDFKPPAIFFINALGVKLFGLNALAYREVHSLLSLAGFFALAIALLTRRVNRVFVGALIAVMIDHYFDRAFHDQSINNAESLALGFFMLGCGVLLMRTRRLRLQHVVGGALLAMSPLSKEPMAFAALFAWVAILLLHRSESQRPDAIKQYALWTIAGAAGVVLTWLVYMLATRSLGAYIVQVKLTLTYAKTYSKQLKWFPKDPAGGLLAEYWRRLRGSYVNTAHLGPFVPLLVAPLALWRGRRLLAAVAALAAACAALYAVTIGQGFAPHYFIMAMTGTFLCTVLGAIALDGAAKGAGPALARWVPLSWATIAVLWAYPRFAEEWGKKYTAPPPPVSTAEIDFVRAHSAPGDSIWTLGNPLLYVFSDRVTAFREAIVIDELIEYYPGATDEERLEGQRKALLAKKPKLIVFGDDIVNYQRKQRYIRALVMPFIRDGGYIKLNEKFYARP